MGLDTTHDCWYGPYSSFNAFRVRLAAAVGIDLKSMEGFKDLGMKWSSLAPDPLHKLLNHSDCDGEIAAADCLPLAVRLEELLPTLAAREADEILPWVTDAARRFATGLRLAAERGEAVEFY